MEFLGAIIVVVVVIISILICGTVVCGLVILAWSWYLKDANPPAWVRRIGNIACICCVCFFIALIPITLCGLIGYHMLGEQLISAASSGDNQTVERILRIGIDVDHMDDGRFSPLMHAAAEGHTDTVKLLLRYHADINHGGGNGDSALKLAQTYGHHDTVRVLKDAGARK